MIIERKIRLISGSLILISLALAVWVNRNFLWLTAFVGASLVQSALTKWCLMEDILKKVGGASATDSCCGGEQPKQP